MNDQAEEFQFNSLRKGFRNFKLETSYFSISVLHGNLEKKNINECEVFINTFNKSVMSSSVLKHG